VSARTRPKRVYFPWPWSMSSLKHSFFTTSNPLIDQFLHRTVTLRTHRPPLSCTTMLGVGVVPFTMESLGAYLFAGAFRFIGTARGLYSWPEASAGPQRPDPKTRQSGGN
jgi:hypothetical protein